MEVLPESSVGDIKFKSHQESENDINDGGKMNGEVNGMSDTEMEVNNTSHNDGCEEEYQPNGNENELCEENGVEPMDTNEGDFVNNDNSEIVNDEDSDNIENVHSDQPVPVSIIRTSDINGSSEVGDNSRSSKDSEVVRIDDGQSMWMKDDFEDVDDVDEIENEDELLADPETRELEAGENLNEAEAVSSEEISTKEQVENSESAIPTDLCEKSDEASAKVEEPEASPVAEETSEEVEDKESNSENQNKDKSDDGETETVSLLTPTKSQGDDDSCVEVSPDKSSKKKKSTPSTPTVPPRRSSRNLNKTKSYVDEDTVKSDDDDVMEVTPSDPLSDDRKPKKNTIVVNDTKRLAEIAAGSKNNRSGKKEPTLVIIDTNSILAGKGAVPASQQSLPTSHMTITPAQPRTNWPVTVSQSNIIHHKPVKVSAVTATPQPHVPPPAPPSKPVILPSLTDDMYVVEAPSFIVPYVYEKPPVNSLKDFLRDLEKTVKEEEKRKEEEIKLKEKEAKENAMKAETKDDSPDGEVKKNEAEDSSKVEDSEVEKCKEGDNKDSTDLKESDVDKEDKSVKEDESEKDAEVKSVDIEEESGKERKEEKSSEGDATKEEEKTDDSDDVKVIGETKKTDNEVLEDKTNKKSDSYFDNPLGKFFMQIGINLVQEHVQADLLRNQQRKRDREGKNCSPDVHMAIESLTKTLESSKENNEPFKFELKKCQLCNFKTESQLVMAHHLETPHMRNFVYRCNFCEMEVRSPHDILFHMEAEHNVRGRLDRSPSFHQCPNCPFEDNQKGKLSRHLLSCARKYKPERNQEPPLEWEPPAKIPRVRGVRGLPGSSVMYPPSLGPRVVTNPLTRLSASSTVVPISSQRGRGRPPIYVQRYPSSQKTLATHIRQGGMVFRPSMNNAQPPVLLPAPYQLAPAHLLQAKSVNNGGSASSGSGATAKLLQQPSISITPLPRGSTSPSSPAVAVTAKPGRPPGSNPSKTTFVICEICDGYIKDLEQLRNHMQWIHKVKIHPKMIYNRPPLNCQKCQFRFFTDQGLERHLLGSHGLVTSSMQEAANKGKDGGRCPVCGRVYQWKLLNHVARDHNMSLKPAHLSYKCTVCTATFGMYKQFENHVYSAHSVVAKRVIDKTKTTQPSTSQSQSEALLKPLKINDEITIIPQPARAKAKAAVAAKAGGNQK